MKTFISYVTGGTALIVVSAAVLVTIHFVVTIPFGAKSTFALAMLKGMGTAMGACIGGALILRFKSARRFLRQLFYEKSD